MRYAIIGSRKRKDRETVKSFVRTLTPNDIVVSGGCSGPDMWAEEAARQSGIKVSIFLPDLPPNGSPRYQFAEAYYTRNRLVVENSDIVHAFVSPDRKGGTEHTIKYAKKRNKPVIIHEA